VTPPFRQLPQAMLDIALRRMTKVALARLFRDLAERID
jgi:hypothetical protein